MKRTKYMFIYNPHSGMKRRFFFGSRRVALEEVKKLLDQYEIPVDYFPTKYPSHATKLAREAIKEDYSYVLVAGGDGTIGEAANGLIGSKVTLGIIPLGSFMNVARMLSIPSDLEKAIQLIKIGRMRKIDMGAVTKIGDRELEEPYYFLESTGVGFWAQLHRHMDYLEKGRWSSISDMLHVLFRNSANSARITLDGNIITTKAIVLTVSNGPFSSAALKIAPAAKLNDHVLTISLYNMSKVELMKELYSLFFYGKHWLKKVEMHQGKHIRIEPHTQRLIHVDGRKFGKTPVEMEIIPNALEVITGFPASLEESAFRKRTYLES